MKRKIKTLCPDCVGTRIDIGQLDEKEVMGSLPQGREKIGLQELIDYAKKHKHYIPCKTCKGTGIKPSFSQQIKHNIKYELL